METAQVWLTIVTSLFGLSGTLIGVVSWIYKRGETDAASTKSLAGIKADVGKLEKMLKEAKDERHDQFKELESKLEKRILDVDQRFREVDQKIAALQGAINLLRDQRGEDRQYLLENYMKVDDIDKIEVRVLQNQKTILDAVSKLEGKLDRVLEGGNTKLIPHRSS
ncbi:hypothetical protein PQI07_22535 [Methylobacterium sp. 092160098-2]|uniref:hypothetical protein n=1 Tax=Methylobacterium sp. 092160098-2 TaxID=3025129 RepID=UPI002381C608|nr:hypothetical protein [Methylobacterium sp. 092160098-2]MDE4913461.1 hypothetical protein [Methylobacterium sp. 092160098-2]